MVQHPRLAGLRPANLLLVVVRLRCLCAPDLRRRRLYCRIRWNRRRRRRDRDVRVACPGGEEGHHLRLGSVAGTSDSENSLAQAIRQGASQSFNQTGEQVVSRSLNVQPTITIRPGFPVRVIVTHDLVLEPYRA
jgi:hypothetical protein